MKKCLLLLFLGCSLLKAGVYDQVLTGNSITPPVTISSPGTYILNGDADLSTTDATVEALITITADNVVLNLNNRIMTGNSFVENGIVVENAEDVTIYNLSLFTILLPIKPANAPRGKPINISNGPICLNLSAENSG